MAKSADEFVWKKSMSVGNAVLDADHKKLIDIVNSAGSSIRASNGIASLQAFNLLIEHMCIHFKNEEMIAQTINAPFFEHEMDHQYVKTELLNMRDELADLNGKWSESAAECYSHFLGAWLYAHLNNEAGMLKSALQIYPYDLDPISEGLPDC
jgi:hemerythrin